MQGTDAVCKPCAAIRSGLTQTPSAASKIEGQIVQLVRGTVSDTLRATGAVASDAVAVAVAREVATGAIQATDDSTNRQCSKQRAPALLAFQSAPRAPGLRGYVLAWA